VAQLQMQSLFYDATLNWEVFFLFWTITKVGAGVPFGAVSCCARQELRVRCF
jgi:hypothetical protein